MGEENKEELKVGDYIRIRPDLGRTHTRYGASTEMEMMAGEIGRIRKIETNGTDTYYRLEGNNWHWGTDMFSETKIDFKSIDDRDRIDFEVGDLIEIRTRESMKKQFLIAEGMDIYCEGIPFVRSMGKYIGKKAIIKDISRQRVILKSVDGKLNFRDWSWSTGMIKIVEKNYKKDTKKIRKDKKMKETDELIINEMIEKVDIKKVKKILASSFQMKSTELLGVDKMLRDWAIAKQELYLILGRNLKISKEIEYEADLNAWREELEKIYQKFPVLQLTNQILDVAESFQAKRLVGLSSYFKDRYMPEIDSNTKVTTFFSKLFKNKEIDIELSKIIDNNKIKGIIEISIDPIDYLLMSVNRSGWQSCHSIHESEGRSWGCYVGGLFSYMADSSTMIAYRHSPEQVQYTINGSRFMEYSKNWRQCIYLDSDTGNFVTSRQYPRNDEVIAKNVRELLEEQVSEYFGFENSWKVINNSETIKEHQRNYDIEDISDWDDGDGSEALHYNDIWYGFEGKLIYNKEKDNLDETDIIVGAEPICPICGVNHILDHELPMCDGCAEY